MTILRTAAFLKARTAIYQHARLLDQQLFDFVFEQADAALVIEALKSYQNPDGGFGLAIQPDLDLTQSSAQATVTAFQILDLIDATTETPLVQAGIEYLMKTYHNGWTALPSAANLAASAGWWRYPQRLPEEYWGYPSAEIVGILHRYAALVPPTFLQRVTRLALFSLKTRSKPLALSDFMSFARLVQQLSPDSPHYAQFSQPLQQIISQQRIDWRNGHLPLWWIFNRPTLPLTAALHSPLFNSLDESIAQQQTDGLWHPTWAWEDSAAETQAFQTWKGTLTVRLLIALHHFACIESPTRSAALTLNHYGARISN